VAARDVREDPRFFPLDRGVNAPVGFFAAAVDRSNAAEPVVLCLADDEPRDFDAGAIATLELLGSGAAAAMRVEQFERRLARAPRAGRRAVDALAAGSNNAELEEQRRREFLHNETQRIAGIGSYELDLVTKTAYCSDELLNIFGLDGGTRLREYKHLLKYVHPEDREDFDEVQSRAVLTRSDFDHVFQIVRSDGKIRTVRHRGRPVLNERSEAVRIFGSVQVVTDPASAPAVPGNALHLRMAFDDAPVAMVLARLGAGQFGKILHVNAAMSKLTGHTAPTLLTLKLEDLIFADDYARVRRDFEQVERGESPSVEDELRLVRSDGTVAATLLHASVGRDARGTPLWAVVQFVDVSERKRAEEQAQHAVSSDTLTGLLNHRRFEEELRQAIATSERYGWWSAVLLIGLDGFGEFTSALGAAAGDAVLRDVARTLRARCRSGDIIARLGAHEFGVILQNVDRGQAETIAEELRIAVGGGVPAGDGKTFDLAARIVVTLLDGSEKRSTEALLTRADVVGSHAVDARAAMQARFALAERIRQALRTDQFLLYRQPIMRLGTCEVERYEILLRLADGSGSPIPPSMFFPVAERFGLLQEIDKWVVRNSIRYAAREREAGRNVNLEVNLSGPSLVDEGVILCIEEELARVNLPRGALCFEITETVAIGNMEQAASFARRLGKLGCEFALDDFGAGFSSFFYLKHLPFDYLKIDGEFIVNLRTNGSDLMIVKAIVDIARGLGKATIAEFVGDEPTADLLRSLGVDFAQGYHIGAPVSLASADATR
jgi:diguanylate cyclase (GGDEF)-like protein/PAS domain S-box-containing protein